MNKIYKIYCDGSSYRKDKNSPWIGGVGHIILDDQDNIIDEGKSAGYYTSQAAELRAAIAGIEGGLANINNKANTSLHIISDSTYTVDTINYNMNYWMGTKDFSKRKNYDLITKLIELNREIDLTAEWVSKDKENEFNQYVHDLANEAREEFLRCEGLKNC